MAREVTSLHLGSFALGMLCGAGLMYVLDPDGGRRRRDRVREGAQRVAGGIRDLLPHEVVDDPVLEERVHEVIEGLVSRPGMVEASADHGRLTLAGTAPRPEMEALIATVERIPGVRYVVNRMRVPEGSDPSGARP